MTLRADPRGCRSARLASSASPPPEIVLDYLPPDTRRRLDRFDQDSRAGNNPGCAPRTVSNDRLRHLILHVSVLYVQQSVPSSVSASTAHDFQEHSLSRQGALLTAFTLCCVSSIAAQAGSPAGPVPVERLTARRDGLARLMGSGIAVLRSSKERDIEGDYPQDSDYRESNDFFYLTGIESKDSWLLVVADSGRATRVTLYLPPRDPPVGALDRATLGPVPRQRR